MTAKPRWARLNETLAAIMPTTRMSGAGKRGANRRLTRMAAATKIDKAAMRQSAHGAAARASSQSWTSVWREATATPSMSPSIATPTCTPTSARNPTSAVRERKSARKPAFKIRATTQEAGRLQRQHADQRHILVAGRRRPLGEGAGEDRRGGRIRRDHQVARRTEEGEGDERQKNGVKPGDDRRAGDSGVAEHLRNVHRGERHAGERVAQRLARPDRKDAAENAEPERAPLRACFAGRRRQFSISCVGQVDPTVILLSQ